MGIIRAAPDTERIGKAWVTSAGMVVACNKGFANLVGYDYNDIAGKHINTVLDHDRVTQLISTAVAGQEGEEFQAEIPARSVFGEEFLCNISTALGGTVTMRVVLLAFDRLSEEVPIVLAEPGTGKVLRANRAMERFSGYKRREIETLKLADLLPEPFATLHTHQYLGEGMGTHPAPVAPCVHGRVAEIVTKNGTVAPMAAEARRIKQPDADAHMQTEMEGDSMVVMLRLRPLSSHAARGSSSMTLKVDRRGTIAHAEPSGAFPASGEALVGRGLGDVVQVGGDVGSLVEELRRAKPATKTARCTVIGEGGRGHAASMDAAIDPSDKERVVVTLHR